MAAPFHIGIVVPRLEAAMAELAEVAGVSWETPVQRDIGEWQLRYVYSIDGPPHIELLEGSPGSPWDAGEGPRLDHTAWATDSVARSRERLEAQGLSVDVEMPITGAVYFRSVQTGMRIELTSVENQRERLHDRLARKPPAGEDYVLDGPGDPR